jgi:hypothetical protein
MGVTLTSMDYALKTLYPDGVTPLVYKNNPLLAMLQKNTKFFGRNKVVDVIYANTQGRSATFANAQANAGSHKGIAFTITRKSDYADIVLDRETIKAAGNDEGAVVDALETETNSAIQVLKNSLAHAVWGDGTGKIGKVASFTGATITLTDVNDAVSFEVGKVINLSSTLSGGAVRSGTLQVSAVNRTTGVITFTQNVTTGISAAANNDYIFTDGDYGKKLTGLQGWLPTTDPSSGESFFGVDRSVDTIRLAGLRYDGSALSIEEALIQAAARLGREEGAPDYCFMNYLDFANLETALGSKKVYEDIAGPYGIGFKGLVIHGPNGDIRAVSDRNAPRGFAYLLEMDTWTLHSLGEAPEIISDDGVKMLRQNSADGFEARMAYYAQLACEAPGRNAVVTLAT